MKGDNVFKSYREFTLDKPVNTKRLKVRHIHDTKSKLACTIVQLHNTDVVHRVNVNNVVTLNSGGWKTPSTKVTMNTAMRLIYGSIAPCIYQSKGKWYVKFNNGDIELYFDGMIIGGGCGAPFAVLN